MDYDTIQAMQAKYEKAEQERFKFETKATAASNTIADMQEMVARLRKAGRMDYNELQAMRRTETRLREALMKYGDHAMDCPHRTDTRIACTCGLVEAVAETQREVEP